MFDLSRDAMQVRQLQLVRRAIKRAASFADWCGYSFSPRTLYEDLDRYAKIHIISTAGGFGFGPGGSAAAGNRRIQVQIRFGF
jgi:predicted DNA-binding transcriptional regulator YafY